MGRKVVVTGAASGIGKATAALLRSRGVDVIGVDRQPTDVVVDLATPDGRTRMVAEVEARTGGRLDAVIACAGELHENPGVIAVNYFGAVATLAGLRPLLARGEAPRAVAVASFAAILPNNEALAAAIERDDETAALAAQSTAHGDYPTTKAALAKWVRRHAVAPEWAGAGVLLNAIAPGPVETPMMRPALDAPGGREEVQRLVPTALRRCAEPEEIAELLAFLASPQNSYILGQVVFIDGGAEANIRGDRI